MLNNNQCINTNKGGWVSLCDTMLASWPKGCQIDLGSWLLLGGRVSSLVNPSRTVKSINA